MPLSVPFTGSCACGAIRYECSAEPIISNLCHCRDCQRASGGAFFPGLYVPKAALVLTGEMTYYEVQGESGNTQRRGFCPMCGSPLVLWSVSYPDVRGLWAASLDDPSGYEPLADIWTASAQPWDYLNPTLPQVEKRPSEAQIQAWLTKE